MPGYPVEHVRRNWRNRPKGWPSGELFVMNPDRPLGRPIAGRLALDVPVRLYPSRIGGVQVDETVLAFQRALEINARTVHAFAKAAEEVPLPSNVEAMLARVPELSPTLYQDALRICDGDNAVEAHQAVIRAAVDRALAGGEEAEELARHLRRRRVLEKGLAHARLLRQRRQRFIHDNVDDQCRPGEEVLLRTFLPFALIDPLVIKKSKIRTLLKARRAFRLRSPVKMNELKIMAFYGLVNSSYMYLDYFYMRDLLDLTRYAGSFALGRRGPMTTEVVSTYRSMLCEGGKDTAPVALRPSRDGYAAALRTLWASVPDLVEETQRFGRLKTA